MSAAFALLVGLAIGFACGQFFVLWSKQAGSELQHPDPSPTKPSRGIVGRFRLASTEIARRSFLGGVCATCGSMPPRPTLVLHFERGAENIDASTKEISMLAAHAYVEGAREVRDALSRCSGIDDGALDQAVAIALEEVAS
jgi:hypothetical protein